MTSPDTQFRGYNISPVTTDDAEALVLCGDRAFHENVLRRSIFPKNREHLTSAEELLAWQLQRMRRRTADEAGHRFKVVDAKQPGKVVANSMWLGPGYFKDGKSVIEAAPVQPRAEPDGTADTLPATEPPTFPASMNVEVQDEFLAKLDVVRKEIWGTNSDYWYLGGLSVDPDYRRQGIAAELLRWGLEQADSAELPVYLESTPEGAPFYPKFGFEKHSEHAFCDGKYVVQFHVRPAKKAV